MTTKRIPNTLKLADGRRVVCKIFDHGGESFDRYTVVLKTKRYRGALYWAYIAASEHPFHPQGFGQHGTLAAFTEGPHLGQAHLVRAVPARRAEVHLAAVLIPRQTPAPQRFCGTPSSNPRRKA